MSEPSDRPCIVVGAHGPFELGHYQDTPRAGVLMNGDNATVFRNRRQARRAVERSTCYARERDFQAWDFIRRPYSVRVMNVVEAP